MHIFNGEKTTQQNTITTTKFLGKVYVQWMGDYQSLCNLQPGLFLVWLGVNVTTHLGWQRGFSPTSERGAYVIISSTGLFSKRASKHTLSSQLDRASYHIQVLAEYKTFVRPPARDSVKRRISFQQQMLSCPAPTLLMGSTIEKLSLWFTTRLSWKKYKINILEKNVTWDFECVYFDTSTYVQCCTHLRTVAVLDW